MSVLFLTYLVRAELRWRECHDERVTDLVCFPYPMYLPNAIKCGIDLHWMGLVLPAALDQLPSSLGGEKARWSSYVVTVLSVVAFWSLLGLWFERLRAERRLQTRGKRAALMVLIVAVGPFILLGLYNGMRGGFEGPTATWASFIPAFLVLGMSVIESGLAAPIVVRMRRTAAHTRS
jgi:hypothetical protein